MLHYSQKRRYYFFIAIAKFKTILSYYPRWRKLPPHCLSFAYDCATLAPHLHHTYATLTPHTLANFQSLPKLISCASSPPPRWRKLPPHCLSFVTYSAVPARRLSFAYPSLILRSTFAYDCATQSLSEKFCFVRAICQSPLQCE